MTNRQLLERNNIFLYERQHGANKKVPLYFVFDKETGKILREFKMITSAEKFMSYYLPPEMRFVNIVFGLFDAKNQKAEKLTTEK